MNKFQDRCDECGKLHNISLTMAGSLIRCSCRSDVEVPPLSELRRSVGLDGYEMPVGEKVIQAVFDKRVPTTRDCVQCGDSRAEQEHLVAVCERSHQQPVGGGAVAGVIAGVPFFLPLPSSSSGARVGRNVIVPLVFHICPSCWMSCLGRSRYVLVFRAITICAIVLGIIFFAIWACLPAKATTPELLLCGGICFVGAVVTYGIALSVATPSLSKLKKGLCAEPIYRELFKAYPDAELIELRAGKEG